MSRFALVLSLVLGLVQGGVAVAADKAEVGKAAPAFALKDTGGKEHKLADYTKQGKLVVLEWLNYDCPFVRKHYDSKNMQKLQKTYTDKGVVWLSVISSAKGKQGSFPPSRIDELNKQKGGSPTAILLDESGSVGKAYGAQTTPHMYVIDKSGKLVYAGAIDDKPTTDEEDIEGAKNHVAAALDETMAGKAVTLASTKAYGCSVKY